MTEKSLDQYICLKRNIDDKDSKIINELQDVCINHDKVNLKLELNYKLTVRKEQSNPVKAVNEFLFYEGDMLIGYLGIANFGGSAAEINGMVHPEWRRKGIFTRLYGLAADECRRRGFEKILLLCDDKSESAKEFIKSTGAKYSFSEYKMKLSKRNDVVESKNLNLRKAKNSDGEIIGKMNSVFFGDPNITIEYPEEEEKYNRITYIIELQGVAIGKIRVESDEQLSYIYGFGILPEYRSKGYGREALAATLNIISRTNINDVYLDVAAGNSRALNLYKSCGFVEESVMNYYEANQEK